LKALDISTAMATTAGPKTENQPEKRKKESILDLSRFLEKSVRIKFNGGRECSGTLKVRRGALKCALIMQTIEFFSRSSILEFFFSEALPIESIYV
jgi:hypothetical protein